MKKLQLKEQGGTMEPIFVTGHRNPDTDSIVSAMAYAALQNALGNREYMAVRLGSVNDETQMALSRFGFEAPAKISNVRTQVRDLEYDTPPVLSGELTVNAAWNVFEKDAALSTLPITDENGVLQGMVTRGDIAAYDMSALNNTSITDVPVFNVLAALEGNVVNNPAKPLDAFNGEIVIALPRTGEDAYGFSEGCIAFVGDQEGAFRRALDARAACIVLCQAEYTQGLKDMAPEALVMYTPLDAYRAARMLHLSLPIFRILTPGKIVSFHLDDYLDDVRSKVLESRFHSYPILDHHERVVGTLSRYHLLNPRRKKIVLVDHNEMAQSVPGLEQSEIVAVIDHHRLADVQTLNPVYVRNEPVGSTNTIIGTMFQEKGLVPPKALAALMATAIVSDTVSFKSPTCTSKDVSMAERLARIGGINLEEVGNAIFTASSSDDKTPKEILFTDYKDFHIAGYDIGIGQVTCMDSGRILARKEELLALMRDSASEKGQDMMLLMITDVLREGTVLLYIGEDDIIRQAFNADADNNETFLPGVVSRKKQVVPALSLMWG